MTSQLTDLQTRVLAILHEVRPEWTLTGGAALAGFHLGHRTTRDLDLFWHGLRVFAREPEDCERLLRAAGLQVDVLQRSPSFVRLRASDGPHVVVLDLVAEVVPPLAAPQRVRVRDATIRIDTEHEIFANKLGTLLHRSEVRDLIDLRALLARGADLASGLRDAAVKDGGFSPLMVAHLLQGFPLQKLADAAGLADAEIADLAAFRNRLAQDILGVALP